MSGKHGFESQCLCLVPNLHWNEPKVHPLGMTPFEIHQYSLNISVLFCPFLPFWLPQALPTLQIPAQVWPFPQSLPDCTSLQWAQSLKQTHFIRQLTIKHNQSQTALEKGLYLLSLTCTCFQTYLIKQSAFGRQGSMENVSSSLTGHSTRWINSCGVCDGATIYQLQPLCLSVLQVQGQRQNWRRQDWRTK